MFRQRSTSESSSDYGDEDQGIELEEVPPRRVELKEPPSRRAIPRLEPRTEPPGFIRGAQGGRARPVSIIHTLDQAEKISAGQAVHEALTSPDSKERAQNPHRFTLLEPLEDLVARRMPLERVDSVQSTEPATPPTKHVDDIEGHCDVTRPAPHQCTSSVNEIEELGQRVRRGDHFRTPSGNMLDSDGFIAREDRPRLIWERQNAILRNAREKARIAKEEEHERAMRKVRAEALRAEAVERMKAEKRARWLPCFFTVDEDHNYRHVRYVDE